MKAIIYVQLIVVLVLGLALASPIQTQGNSQCAQFCHDTFPTSSKSGAMITAAQCTSQAARGTGPCYTCGPAQTGAIHIDACSQGTSQATCCTQQAPKCVGGNCVSTCPADAPLRYIQDAPSCVSTVCVSSPSACCQLCKTTSFTAADGADCEGHPCDAYFVQSNVKCGATNPYRCEMLGFEGSVCPNIDSTTGNFFISYCLSSL